MSLCISMCDSPKGCSNGTRLLWAPAAGVRLGNFDVCVTNKHVCSEDMSLRGTQQAEAFGRHASCDPSLLWSDDAVPRGTGCTGCHHETLLMLHTFVSELGCAVDDARHQGDRVDDAGQAASSAAASGCMAICPAVWLASCRSDDVSDDVCMSALESADKLQRRSGCAAASVCWP